MTRRRVYTAEYVFNPGNPKEAHHIARFLREWRALPYARVSRGKTYFPTPSSAHRLLRVLAEKEMNYRD